MVPGARSLTAGFASWMRSLSCSRGIDSHRCSVAFRSMSHPVSVKPGKIEVVGAPGQCRRVLLRTESSTASRLSSSIGFTRYTSERIGHDQRGAEDVGVRPGPLEGRGDAASRQLRPAGLLTFRERSAAAAALSFSLV